MRKIRNKIIGAAALCVLAPSAFASSEYFRAPYLGVEVIQTNQNYKSGYGKDVYKKNPQDYSVFGGFKFSKHFGAEIGYEYQPRRGKNTTLTAGQALPGRPPLAGTAGVSSYIRGNHPYVGLFGEYDYKLCHLGNVKFQALIGASVSHISARDTTWSLNGGLITPAVRNYSQTHVVPMVKVSAAHNITERVGVRVSVNYRNMTAFKIKSNTVGSGAQIKLKDTWGVGLGLTYSFF